LIDKPRVGRLAAAFGKEGGLIEFDLKKPACLPARRDNRVEIH